jgi:hypothetical protein
VLAAAYDGHALCQGKARQPMLWTAGYGQGRIFVTTFTRDAAGTGLEPYPT